MWETRDRETGVVCVVWCLTCCARLFRLNDDNNNNIEFVRYTNIYVFILTNDGAGVRQEPSRFVETWKTPTETRNKLRVQRALRIMTIEFCCEHLLSTTLSFRRHVVSPFSIAMSIRVPSRFVLTVIRPFLQIHNDKRWIVVAVYLMHNNNVED